MVPLKQVPLRRHLGQGKTQVQRITVQIRVVSPKNTPVSGATVDYRFNLDIPVPFGEPWSQFEDELVTGPGGVVQWNNVPVGILEEGRETKVTEYQFRVKMSGYETAILSRKREELHGVQVVELTPKQTTVKKVAIGLGTLTGLGILTWIIR